MPTKFSATVDYAEDLQRSKLLDSTPVCQMGTIEAAGGSAHRTSRTTRSARPLQSFLAQVAQDLRTGLPLLLADALGLIIAFTGAALVANLVLTKAVPFSLFSFTQSGRYASCLLIYALLGLYPGVGLNPIVELKNQILGTVTAFLGLVIAGIAHNSGVTPQTTVTLVAGLFALFLVPLARAQARDLLGRTTWWSQPALIIGGGSAGSVLYDTLLKRRGIGLRPIGVLDDLESMDDDTPVHRRYLGPLSQVDRIAAEQKVHWALIALHDRPQDSVGRALEQCQCIPHVIVVPGFEELPSLWNRAHDLGGVMGIHLRERLLCPSAQILKRTFDLTVVILGCIAISPLLLGLLAFSWIATRSFSPGPMFYGQERIGKDGKRFLAWKFRTMVVGAEQILQQYLKENPEAREEWNANQKLRNDPRIIPGIGEILRKTSLDELPQLWNVFRGEMSLIGPRPITPCQIQMYGTGFNLYRKVRPGITGLWQISGRNLTTFSQRAQFDAYYVRNWSLWMDLFIFARTVKTVILREGAF
ncbi:undecaprenyl-phosphate galactose phosphotransferase WbaP [Planctomicrobium sp. SH664]|uniref:undecaprenyl-phosphate galactose phosphotransferase WbaP n=1 Tax=Planctomicrobium sp. SH664 TaxID=3448125 RepID=UPI003F5AEA32